MGHLGAALFIFSCHEFSILYKTNVLIVLLPVWFIKYNLSSPFIYLLPAFSSLLCVQTDLCSDTGAGRLLINFRTPAVALLSALN